MSKRKNNLANFDIPESQKATIKQKMKEDGERIVKLFKDVDSEAMPVFQRRLGSANRARPGPLPAILKSKNIERKRRVYRRLRITRYDRSGAIENEKKRTQRSKRTERTLSISRSWKRSRTIQK
jgi:hypothetical protein